jgi:lipopolysaccharide export system ATP-binding protein
MGRNGRFDIAALFRRRPPARRRMEAPARSADHRQHFADTIPYEDAHRYDDPRYDQDGQRDDAFHQQTYAAGQTYEAEQAAWGGSPREHLGSPREHLAYAQGTGPSQHSVPMDQQGWDEPSREAYDLDQPQAPGMVRRQRLWDDERSPQPTEDLEPASGDEPQWDRHEAAQHYLAVHGVEKSFGGRKVVKGVSLYLRRGEAVGLLGPNGAGKTTVFYMITGLVKADRGRIELDGNDITGLPMYQHGRLGIGYLPQEASIFRGLNVEQNIRAVLEQVEPDRHKREAELDALLDEFNITRLRKTPSIALSGGERRRVEIARALATRPAYMLLDEPFAGIDPIAVGDIQALVRHLTQRGIGVLITDHNVRETLGLTDRAYIIYSGEVLTEGNTSDIVSNPEVRRLYLGADFRL